MSKNIEKKLIEKFKDKDFFTREELFDFFQYFEPYLKEKTFTWRIYNLKNKDIIKSIKRGIYTISNKPKYIPQISSKFLKIANQINMKYDEVKYCIWDTEWLNEFSQHQANKQILIIEIEKEFIESLYYHLKDNFKFDIYLNPDEKVINFYIAESDCPVIVKKLIARSPIVKITKNKTKLTIPALEKILVDIYSEEKLFYFYQGSELRYIFENAIANYTVNFTKLFRYASRREKEKKLKSFLTKNFEGVI